MSASNSRGSIFPGNPDGFDRILRKAMCRARKEGRRDDFKLLATLVKAWELIVSETYEDVVQ